MLTKIASIHSFGGATDTVLTANLLVAIARLGYRVGVLDTGAQAPTIHVCFGLDIAATDQVWNDFIWNDEGAESLTGNGQTGATRSLAQHSGSVDLALPTVVEGAGEVAVMGRGIYLVPDTIRADDLSRALREGHDVEPLKEGLHSLVNRLQLDILLINTHPGTTEEIVFSIALSDTLVIVLRPDQIEYQATAVTVEIGRQLQVPKILLVVDDLPANYDVRNVHEQVENTFNTVVAGVLPADGSAAATTAKDIFYRDNPDHPWSREVARIARQIIE
jgi:MinD-like ATPase involved in chromosome partitioning or flagellar assembly